jgi:hypothetical protein
MGSTCFHCPACHLLRPSACTDAQATGLCMCLLRKPAGGLVAGATAHASVCRQHVIQGIPFCCACTSPGTFRLTLEFSEDYPNKAPVVKFKSTMFHPNSEHGAGGVSALEGTTGGGGGPGGGGGGGRGWVGGHHPALAAGGVPLWDWPAASLARPGRYAVGSGRFATAVLAVTGLAVLHPARSPR